MAARDVNSIPDPRTQEAHRIEISGTGVDHDGTEASQGSKEIQNDTPKQNTASLHLLSREHRNFYLKICVPLYTAALKGDWRTAKDLLGETPRSILCASITAENQTALHIASGARQTGFVQELVNLMEPGDLTLQDHNGNTAFCFAAAAGAIEIARIMLEKNPVLLKIRGGEKMTPVYMAVLFAHRDMASFLYSEAKDATDTILTGEDKIGIFFACLKTDLYDLAIQLLTDNPKLAVARDENQETALHILARQPLSFSQGRNRGLLKTLISSFPGVKLNHNMKLTSTQALQLVKCLWKIILNEGDLDLKDLTSCRHSQFMFDAAKFGNFEFLDELICGYPDLVGHVDDNNHSIFHIAVLYRHANIFSLIEDIGFNKKLILTYEDNEKNNILHLAAKFPHLSRVSIVAGAALQMQRELLWFKEIEKIVQPSYREKKNSKGQTPQELFTLEHKDLSSRGELWMKNTANSCMLVATLITTVIFAAALTIPGGNNSVTGIPIHLTKTLFQIFVISDVIALSSSSISIMMFLSILTSRYAEGDFLRSLPFKLMVGLSTLFISMITMMIAFSTTFFIAYHDRLNWVTIFITILASVPATLFVLLQYPLLRDIFNSTYHSRFLFKRRKYML